MAESRVLDLERTKLAELVGNIRFGLLTTIAEDGSLWSLPVFTQEVPHDGELWFFASLGSPLANELLRHQRVSLCYAQPADRCYVSLTGTCELLCDSHKAAELWDSSYEKWLPGGPHDPSLLLVRVVVEGAEYWNAPTGTWPVEAGFTPLSSDRSDNPEYHAKLEFLYEGGPVIVRTGPSPSCLHIEHARCYHRTFPAAMGFGETPRQAAEDLLRCLNKQRDTVEDLWHLEKVDAALAEVRDFLAQDAENALAPALANSGEV